jgi:hypothetical protein
LSPHSCPLFPIPLSLSLLIPLTSLRTTLSSIPHFTSLPSHYSQFSSFAHIPILWYTCTSSLPLRSFNS